MLEQLEKILPFEWQDIHPMQQPTHYLAVTDDSEVWLLLQTSPESWECYRAESDRKDCHGTGPTPLDAAQAAKKELERIQVIRDKMKFRQASKCFNQRSRFYQLTLASHFARFKGKKEAREALAKARRLPRPKLP